MEEQIKNVIETKLSDGTVEKIISERIEKAIADSVDSLFRQYGGAGKLINEKMSEILIPAIENYDFSKHAIKLDTILTEIINSTTLVDNKKILENFEGLMTETEDFKSIKISELFEKYCSSLNGYFEDESINLSMEVIERERPSWSSFEYLDIAFTCEEHDEYNTMFSAERYNGGEWKLSGYPYTDIHSLRYLTEFEVFILALKRSFCKVEVDSWGDERTIGDDYDF